MQPFCLCLSSSFSSIFTIPRLAGTSIVPPAEDARIRSLHLGFFRRLEKNGKDVRSTRSPQQPVLKRFQSVL
jgi:hypothetical protein